MKVTVRTVTGRTFQLEFAPETQIKDVKLGIAEAQPDLPADALNIIYQGKILKDDVTLTGSNVSESGFIVVMVIKKKAEPKSEPAAPAAAPAPTPAAPAPAAPAPPAPATETAAPASGTPEATAGSAAAGASAGGYEEAASQLARGSELEAKVAAIVDMGFPREEVQRAMRAAFNNPERAVEYLMSGIPAGLGDEERPAAPTSSPAPGSATPAPAPAAPFDMFAPGAAEAAPGAAGPLDFLRSNQQFQMLKAMVQQNPALLQPMLQELGRNNPALLEQINANQAAFLAMINEPSAAGGADLETLVQQLAGEYEGGEGGGEAMDEGDVPPGANVVEVHLSPEEVEAVERLVGLGFDRQVCLEAFLICDKNETLAANYLLENGQDA
ncbi:RAD23 [Auxenochlorella protothecoides x Auxenochlorella symbiontica]